MYYPNFNFSISSTPTPLRTNTSNINYNANAEWNHIFQNPFAEQNNLFEIRPQQSLDYIQLLSANEIQQQQSNQQQLLNQQHLNQQDNTIVASAQSNAGELENNTFSLEDHDIIKKDFMKFDDFLKWFDEYNEKTNQLFTVTNSSIESDNYRYRIYKCIYHKDPTKINSRGNGERPVQNYYATGCKAHLRVFFSNFLN